MGEGDYVVLDTDYLVNEEEMCIYFFNDYFEDRYQDLVDQRIKRKNQRLKEQREKMESQR